MNDKLPRDIDELGEQLFNKVEERAKVHMPAPVQVDIVDGSMQFDSGWVWGRIQDRYVRVILMGPYNLAGASASTPYTIWALPPSPDSPSTPYLGIGVALVGQAVGSETGPSRIPPIITSEITDTSGADLGGTVTSVAMTVPSILSVAGSPITTSGTLAVTLATQSANLVFAGPASGGAATPTFRSIAAADIPIALILAGQAGGQTASGGTASGEDLTLNSTAHATKGSVFLAGGLVEFDEANQRGAIGGATVANRRLVIYPGADATNPLAIRQHSSTQSAALFAWQDSSGNNLGTIAASGSVNINGTLATTAALVLGGTIVSSDTTQQQVIQSASLLTPTGATLTNYYGIIFQARIGTSTTAISNMRAAFFRLDSAAGWNGTIANAYTMHASSPSWTGGTPIPDNITQIEIGALSLASATTNTGLNIGAISGSATNYAIRARDGLYVFNEDGTATADFRIESDTDANNYFSDASANNNGMGTDTPDASAKLDLVSTTKGFLAPRHTTAQRDAVSSPADGLIDYNTDSHRLTVYQNTAWVEVDDIWAWVV